MRRSIVRLTAAWALAGLCLAGAACETRGPLDSGAPAAPRSLTAYYHAYAIHLSWELAPQWDGEPFRIYARRTTDSGWFLIAEVTNCAGGVCTFSDVNVAAGATYLYYVTAVDQGGAETASSETSQVSVPQPVAPPVPAGHSVIALDGANYLRWDPNARTTPDFSHYRVWLEAQEGALLLGETDSEGFLDLLAENGSSYSYFVSAVDDQGHESGGSGLASGTPRPDFHNEWVYNHFDDPSMSGFRFQESDETVPIVSGTSPDRHFRLEADGSGWWLVPGPNTRIHPTAWVTTALKCGVGADVSCVDLSVAPVTGYQTQDVGLLPQSTYALRVQGDDGQERYGAIRVEMLGSDGDGRNIMIFDWAYQLQPGNPGLAPPLATSR